MAESQPVPFVNKGLSIKKDPAQLGPGEFYNLENCTSIQEGSLTARTGHQKLTQASLAAACVSLSKLNLGGADTSNPRYLGSGTSLYRDVPPYSSNTSVYSGLTSGQRWSAQQYNAGTAGTPALYFATKTAALRDNGSYATLQKWGVDPPPIPVIASQAAPTVAYVNDFTIGSSTTNRFTSANSSGSPNYEKSLTAVNILNPAGGTAGYAQITPTDTTPVFGLDGVFVGMRINITDPIGYTGTVNTVGTAVTWASGNQFQPDFAGGTITINSSTYTVASYNSPTSLTLGSSAGTHTGVNYNFPTEDELIVVSTDGTSLYGWLTDPNPIANSPYLTAGQAPITAMGAGVMGIASVTNTIDASFNGVAPTYDSNDIFHVSLYVSVPANVSKIAIQVVPNYTATPMTYPTDYASDYYEFDINPQSWNTSSNSATSQQWMEIDIPKDSFTAVGNAGTGAYVWNNVNQVYVVATFTGAATVQVGQPYFIGGGGLNSAAAGTTQYDWLYIFRNPTSGAVGNPCQFMIPANYPPPFNNGTAILTLTGTAAAATIANGIGEISGAGSIKVYRRGGTFSDGFYRHVGYAANPGSGGTVTFTDNASDASLDTADTLEFDNDPPVPSSLPVTLTANILEYQPSGGGTDYATSSDAATASVLSPEPLTTNATVRLVLSNLPTNFTAASIATPGTIYNITVGTTVQVGFGPNFENSIVSAVGYGTTGHATSAWIELYLQYNHYTTAADASDSIEIDAILRGTCDLVHQDFDCVFLAGDINNPATLYQSKVGRPEAFPVVNLENNFAQQINVGSPSNPINGITSIGPGELVCLNLNNLFIVQMWAGQMQAPIQAPATRGLYSKWCWCKGDNRIWYLGYDGIYTWAGGESQKVSEQIDYLFKKQTINGIAPADLTKALKFSFSYAENSLYIVYIDTNGIYHRLRFETLYNRWTIETIYQASTGASTYQIDCLFTEPDTGNFLVSISNAGASAYLWLCDFYSTTDGWVNLPTDGTEIQYTAWKWWPIANPTADYQVGEVLLELQNPSDSVTAQLFFNYSTTATNTINISSGAVPLRNRYFSAVNSEVGVVQYSIGLKLTGATGSSGLSTFYTFQWRDFAWTGSPDGLPREFGWLEIDCNTNGVSIPMELQLDGTTVYSFSISGTFFNRASTITLPLGLTGIQYRIVPVTGNSGTIQIYKITPHDYPWNDFKSALPKEYSWLEIQANTNGATVPMALQIDGVTVYTFNISGTFFNPTTTITLPLNLNGIQWRVLPNIAGYTGIVQIFSMIPRDFAWSDSGYPGPKTFNWLSIEINTNGVSVPFEFQLDGGAQTFTFNLSGTFQNRLNTITLPSNYTGTLWRVTPTVVGYTGMIQIFSVTPQFQKLPIPITHFDALYQIFGTSGWRFIFQIFLDYQCAVPIVMSIYRDGNVLFLQQTLPAFPQRDVTRFYLPAVNTPSGGTPQFNKSQGYRIELDSSDGITPFQLYRDGSRIELHNLSTDQREGFQSSVFWELIPVQA